MDHCSRCKVKVFLWPSHSHDLNIIENLWVGLKGAAMGQESHRTGGRTQFCYHDNVKGNNKNVPSVTLCLLKIISSSNRM